MDWQLVDMILNYVARKVRNGFDTVDLGSNPEDYVLKANQR